MNSSHGCGIPEDILETYSWGRLSELESAPLEEHLLLCRACQERLEQIDEYLRVAKAATAALAETSPPDSSRSGGNLSNVLSITHPVCAA
jgi:hypothetical protein